MRARLLPIWVRFRPCQCPRNAVAVSVRAHECRGAPLYPRNDLCSTTRRHCMALSAGTRRTVACVLVGLGALLIVAALMIPTYTVGKMAKTPLDLEITTVAVNQEDQESLVLDSTSLTEEGRSAEVNENVPLVSQRFLTIEDPSDADQMTIQAGNSLRRIDKRGDTGVLTAYVDRVTIDRTTGEPVSTDPNGSIAMT